jgi:hypothetical protein
MNTFSLKLAATLFVLQIFVDASYCLYTMAVSDRKPARAATIGAGMHFLMAFGVVSYVKNYAYVIPLAAGSWVGTYIALKFDQRNK